MIHACWDACGSGFVENATTRSDGSDMSSSGTKVNRPSRRVPMVLEHASIGRASTNHFRSGLLPGSHTNQTPWSRDEATQARLHRLQRLSTHALACLQRIQVRDPDASSTRASHSCARYSAHEIFMTVHSSCTNGVGAPLKIALLYIL
jgi:hypothetical protein